MAGVYLSVRLRYVTAPRDAQSERLALRISQSWHVLNPLKTDYHASPLSIKPCV